MLQQLGRFLTLFYETKYIGRWITVNTFFLLTEAGN
jgi:hypothetical protein